MKKWISAILFRVFQREVKQDPDKAFKVLPEHRVSEAFVSEGVQYWKFDNMFEMPCERALQAMNFYEEFRQGCDREYLLAFSTGLKSILSADKFTLESIKTLDKLRIQLDERLKLMPVDLIYKLASVVYYDMTEDPYKYDQKYNAKKIAAWKLQNIDSFFLSMPISDLIPFLKDSGINFSTYSAAQAAINKAHLADLWELLCKSSLMTEELSIFFSDNGFPDSNSPSAS